MVDIDSVMKKVRQYARSEEGKTKMSDTISDARKKGKKLSEAGHLTTEEEMHSLADAMIEIIKKHLPDSIAELGDSLYYSDVFWNYERGMRKMAIYFDKDDIKRPSIVWDGEERAKGVDNIVALLNNGAHAEGYVLGFWEGHTPYTHEISVRSHYRTDSVFIKSTQDRDPLMFMQDAVSEFNRKFGKKYHVVAYCGSDYTKGNSAGTLKERVILQA